MPGRLVSFIIVVLIALPYAFAVAGGATVGGGGDETLADLSFFKSRAERALEIVTPDRLYAALEKGSASISFTPKQESSLRDLYNERSYKDFIARFRQAKISLADPATVNSLYKEGFGGPQAGKQVAGDSVSDAGVRTKDVVLVTIVGEAGAPLIASSQIKTSRMNDQEGTVLLIHEALHQMGGLDNNEQEYIENGFKDSLTLFAEMILQVARRISPSGFETRDELGDKVDSFCENISYLDGFQNVYRLGECRRLFTQRKLRTNPDGVFHSLLEEFCEPPILPLPTCLGTCNNNKCLKSGIQHFYGDVADITIQLNHCASIGNDLLVAKIIPYSGWHQQHSCLLQILDSIRRRSNLKPVDI